MPIEQIIVLALIQGITEFLPISSSGHLILVPVFFGWADQGLIVDVMVHLGSLLAIIVYFWRDVLALIGGVANLLRGRTTREGWLAVYIVLATIPAVLFGLYAKKSGLTESVRGPTIVAWNAIIFGLIMLVADWFSPALKRIEQMTLGSALIVGIAQALALFPGVSRSGITITTARALQFTRPEAARFSFLLGIPAIFGAGVLVLSDAIRSGEPITHDAVLTGGLTFFTSIATIAFLMAVLRKISLWPFVAYRVLLGIVLLALINMGLIFA